MIVGFGFIQNNEVVAEKMVLNILCWKDYTKPYAKEFIQLIKEKYQIDIKLNIKNISKASAFWDATRSKRADLISPAHNILKSKKWEFIETGVALSINLNNIPNYKKILPVFQKNWFVTKDDNIFAVPYAAGTYYTTL